MKSIVYCHDRHATHKRLAATLIALLTVAGGALFVSRDADAAPIVRLPTVVILGKCVRPEKLPRVVVVVHRQTGTQMARVERSLEMKRVAFAPPAAGY